MGQNEAAGENPLRILVLVKQVPVVEALDLGSDLRLDRTGQAEMNAYCRRAVAKGVELASTSGTCEVLTLGPPSAADVLAEALAWGADRAHLVTDPAFAGSDTLATARAVAAVVHQLPPYDLILLGKNSVDADTGQVGPQIAELLDLPFIAAAAEMSLSGRRLDARCETDNGSQQAAVDLPAVVSCAERLCAPAKVPVEQRDQLAAVGQTTIWTASALGPGPWGQTGSPTRVDRLRDVTVARQPLILHEHPLVMARRAVDLLHGRGIFDRSSAAAAAGAVHSDAGSPNSPVVAVVAQPRRPELLRELLSAGSALAIAAQGRVVALTPDKGTCVGVEELSAQGTDELVQVVNGEAPDVFADGISRWAAERAPWVILAPGTAWGREVSGRSAAALGVGLVSDAVELEVRDGRLIAWKPAVADHALAAIVCSTATQMATLRPGSVPVRRQRTPRPIPRTFQPASRSSRIERGATVIDDEPIRLERADVVIGVGRGVAPECLALLEPLRQVLGAELAASRRVTDAGLLPRSRQVGITGRSISPALYICIGISGKLNHMTAVQGSGTILAINSDPSAPVFRLADIGLVGDWLEVVPAIVDQLRGRKPDDP